FFQAEDGIRDRNVTGVQTCALPIWVRNTRGRWSMQPVPGGYKIRPYSVDGGACGRRSARTRGVAGRCGHRPLRGGTIEPRENREPVRAAIQAAPTGKPGAG